MFELHETKEGHTMLICQMDDSHLINMIRILCHKINQGCQILENQNFKRSAIFHALNSSLSKELKEEAKKQIRLATQKLSPYVLEASLRELPITTYLQEAFGRKAKLPNCINYLSLNSQKLSSNIDEYEDRCLENDETWGEFY